MYLNQFGKIVFEILKYSEKIRDEIILDYFVVMPNHLHAILFIEIGEKFLKYQEKITKPEFKIVSKSLGSFVGGFKASVTKRIRRKSTSISGITISYSKTMRMRKYSIPML